MTTIPTPGVTALTPGTHPPAATSPAAGGPPAPDHGTSKRYNHGPDEHDQPGHGCRCTPCRQAHATNQRDFRRRRALETWGAAEPPMVDAEPARAHVRALMAEGVGWERIATTAGVGTGSVAALLYGKPRQGLPPSARIRQTTADKLLAVTQQDIADAARIDATGTQRRLRALIAVGWSASELMRRLGKTETNFWHIIRHSTITAKNARAVRELYSELWDQPPPEHNDRQRAAAARSRNRARRAGWPPPMAWDEDIDDPQARPHGVHRAEREAIA